MADPYMDARAAGYSWDDIDEQVGRGGADALDEGYSPEEIRRFLGGHDPGPMEDMAGASWHSHLSSDEDLQAAILASSAVPDLSSNPAWAAHYANAVGQRHVDTPEDFADVWAAAATNAATRSGDDIPDDDQDRTIKENMARASDAFAPRLPHPRDFTDGALALQSEDNEQARRNLIRNWRDTGQEPLSAVAEARKDPEAYAALTTPEPAGPGFFDRFGSGVRDMLGGAAQFMTHLLPQGVVDAGNWANNALADAGVPLARIGDGGLDALETARQKMLKEQGYDGWVRWGGQVIAAAPLFTTLGLEGLGATVAAGLTGGAAFGAFTPSEAEDYWGNKLKEISEGAAYGAAGGAVLHGLFTGIGRVIKAMSPEAAAQLKEIAPKLLDEKVKVLDPADVTNPIKEVSAETANLPNSPATLIDRIAALERDRTASDLGERAAGSPSRSFSSIAADELAAKPRFEIDPEASPAAKLQRMSMMHLDEKAFGAIDEKAPGFFEKIYKAAVDGGHMAPDAKVEALAVGHDAAAGQGSTWLDMLPGPIRRLMQDEQGATLIPAFRTPLQAAQKALEREQRDASRDLLIRHMGLLNDSKMRWAEKFQPLQKALDPYLDEWRRVLRLGPAAAAGAARNTEIGQFLSAVENYSKGVRMAPDHPLAPWVETVREFNQATDKRLRMQHEDPNNPLTYEGFIQDYMAHQFEDPAAAMAHFGVESGAGGKLGSKGNLMERTGPPTLLDAVESGQKLKYDDPFQMLLHDMHAKWHLSQYADTVQEAREAGYLRWTPSKLPGDVRLDTTFGHKSFIQGPDVGSLNTKTGAIRTAQDVLDEQRPGEIDLYGHPMFIKQVRQWLDNGLYAKPTTTGRILDVMTYAKNASTSLKLAFAAFHTGVVLLGSIAGSFGRGLEGTARGWMNGDGRLMAESIGDMLMAPIAPVRDYRLGTKAMAIRSVQGLNDRIIKALTEQNYNFGGLSRIEKLQPQNSTSFFESLFAGRSMADYLKAPDGGLLGREVKDAFERVKGNPMDAPAYSLLRMPDRMAQETMAGIMKAASIVNGPLFEDLIPKLKLGQAYRRMQMFYRANPGATPEAVAKYARQVTQDVDNRLGELQLDNVFWSRTTKQLINAATISTSWTYGTYRGLASAFGFDLERHAFQWNPVATTNLVGTAFSLGLANSLLGYFHTGQAPQDWRDLLNFRTGGLGSGMMKTTPERGLVPTEMKEIYDLGGIIAKSWQVPTKAPEGAMDYALGKLNPFWQMVRGLVTGHDAIGHDISLMPGGMQRFMKEQLNPIALGAVEGRTKQTGLHWLENAIGIREAPKWSEDWSRFQGDEKKGMGGVYARISKEEIKRARREVGDLETRPGWADQIPPEQQRPGRQRAADRAFQKFEESGSMAGITNPRQARYLNTLRDYRKQQADPWLSDPAYQRATGTTLPQRLQRARRAGPFDPVTGY